MQINPNSPDLTCCQLGTSAKLLPTPESLFRRPTSFEGDRLTWILPRNNVGKNTHNQKKPSGGCLALKVLSRMMTPLSVFLSFFTLSLSLLPFTLFCIPRLATLMHAFLWSSLRFHIKDVRKFWSQNGEPAVEVWFLLQFERGNSWPKSNLSFFFWS